MGNYRNTIHGNTNFIINSLGKALKILIMFGIIEEPINLEYIKVINGRWTLNRKQFHEMTINETRALAEKIKQ